jgi:predicted Abi (CAAX) family protease
MNLQIEVEQLFIFPDLNGFIITSIALSLLAIFLVPLGFKTGFLKVQALPRKQTLLLFPKLLILPAIFEEFIFRGLLLPPIPSGFTDPNLYLASLNLFGFVIMHPINAKLFFKRSYPTFLNSFFLFSTFVIGLICTILTWHTKSLIPAILVHWIVVVVWIVLFGGYQKLNT